MTTIAPVEHLLQTTCPSERHRQFEELVGLQRDTLRQMIAARLDQRLRQRIDASDVVQEALLVAFNRLDDFAERRPMRFDLWLRYTTLQQLIDLRRRHFARQRDARSEVPMADRSALILIGKVTDQAAVDSITIRRERLQLVRRAVADLDVADRDILMIRYVDGLSNVEAAALLEITPAAASKRHGRALVKLAASLRRLGLNDETYR